MKAEKDLNPRALPSGSEALRSAGQTVAMRAGQRYTEAQLMEFEKSLGKEVCELTDYIRRMVGTVEIPAFPPIPDAIQRSIQRHRRKVAYEQTPKEILLHLKRTERLQLSKRWRMKATSAGGAA